MGSWIYPKKQEILLGGCGELDVLCMLLFFQTFYKRRSSMHVWIGDYSNCESIRVAVVVGSAYLSSFLQQAGSNWGLTWNLFPKFSSGSGEEGRLRQNLLKPNFKPKRLVLCFPGFMSVWHLRFVLLLFDWSGSLQKWKIRKSWQYLSMYIGRLCYEQFSALSWVVW